MTTDYRFTPRGVAAALRAGHPIFVDQHDAPHVMASLRLPRDRSRYGLDDRPAASRPSVVATTPDEALQALAAGADVVVATAPYRPAAANVEPSRGTSEQPDPDAFGRLAAQLAGDMTGAEARRLLWPDGDMPDDLPAVRNEPTERPAAADDDAFARLVRDMIG